MLPSNALKYIELVLLFASSVLFLCSNFRNLSLIILSILILVFESTTQIKVPFLIHILEATIKIVSPIILLTYLKNNELSATIVKSSILITFIAHGLLAMNVIQTPDSFYKMVNRILKLQAEHAEYFLFIVGVVDILSSFIIILSPKNNTLKIAVWYCIIWGFVTALARTLYVYDDTLSEIMITFITETIIRLPNSLIPLVLFVYIQTTSKNDKSKL